MRIMMLTWEYPPKIVGGISRVVHGIARELGKNGNEVHVATFNEAGMKEFEKDGNVYVSRVNACGINANNFVDWALQMNFSLVERCIRLFVETGRFDIIHAHDWLVAFAAKTLKNAFKTPLISTIHATESGRNWGIHNDTQKYINDVEWMLTYESWKVIVNSLYMKNEVKNLFGLPEDKIYVIPNGVNKNRFNGCERDYGFRRKYAADNEKLIFFVGRLVNEKGAQVLVDAVPKVLHHFRDAKFVIAGKGPQLDYLRGKAAVMDISHKVYFTGYISDEDLGKFFKCADIAVFPSLYEPFGIVALEGMAAGIPVVASDTGGMGEVVCHEVDGMKCYTGNANSLADCILELLFNPGKAEEMKKRALDKVDKIYNWEAISGQTLEVYTKVAEEGRKAEWA